MPKRAIALGPAVFSLCYKKPDWAVLHWTDKLCPKSPCVLYTLPFGINTYFSCDRSARAPRPPLLSLRALPPRALLRRSPCPPAPPAAVAWAACVLGGAEGRFPENVVHDFWDHYLAYSIAYFMKCPLNTQCVCSETALKVQLNGWFCKVPSKYQVKWCPAC